LEPSVELARMRTKLNGILLAIVLICSTVTACSSNDQQYSCDNPTRLSATIAPENSPEITATLKTFVDASSQTQRDAAVDALTKLGPQVIVPLFSLRKDSCYWGTALMDGMYEVAKRIGTPAIPKLITILKAPDPEPVTGRQAQAVFVAADALGQFGAVAIPQITPLLKDSDMQVRLNATIALAEIGKPAIPQLVAISKQDAKPEVRDWAAKALKESGYKAKPK
jgi:HEAT repeat protein